jgi:DNA-binding IclR family transcriptional regulator
MAGHLLLSNSIRAHSFARTGANIVAEPSNPTGRVLDILNFLAAHPTERFTLAEIARHLGLSNGSAHRVLTAMTAAQYLSRHETHRTYSLGVALVAIGQAAVEKHRGIEVARREIARLSVELNVQCSANVVADDDLLVVIKEGMAQSHQGFTRVGERRPFIPPLGQCHVAWAGETAIQSYIAKVSGHLSAAMQAHLLAAMPLIRSRGYAIAANGPNTHKTRQAAVLPIGQSRDAAYWESVLGLAGQMTARELQLLDISEAGPEGISYLSAPVFAPDGSASLQLVISGMPNALSTKKIERYAERLCAAAALITSETHGQPPTD